MPGDDRNRPKHPPLIQNDDEWDDATPTATPPPIAVEQTSAMRAVSRLSTQPGAGVDERRPASEKPSEKTPSGGSARAALAKINELGRKFDDHARMDKEALDAIHDTLREHSGTLGDLRESSAATTATLVAIKDELLHVRQIQLLKVEGEQKVQLVRVEGEVKTGLETARHQRIATSWRARILIALIGVLGAGVGAFAKWLTDDDPKPPPPAAERAAK